MAAKIQNPFTNTRLMLAGVACGIIGAVCAVIYVKGVVSEKVGEEVTVYYMKEELKTTEPLKLSHYGEARVRKSFVRKVDKIIWGDGVQRFHGVKPSRTLKPGEPLVTTWFDSRIGITTVRTPAAGLKAKLVPVNPKLGLGESMNIGSIVSVVGKFHFGQRGQPDYEERTLRLLERVQVEAINGQVKPDERARRRVTSITVYLGKETSEWVTAMLDQRVGDMSLEGESEGVRKSEPNKEIPAEVLDVIKDKLGV